MFHVPIWGQKFSLKDDMTSDDGPCDSDGVPGLVGTALLGSLYMLIKTPWTGGDLGGT